MSRSPRGMAALAFDAVVALALFGCIPVAVKSIHANAYTIGIVRLAISVAFVALLTIARHELRALPWRDFWMLFGIGALFFAHWLTYFLSVKMSTVSIGAIGLSTYGVDLLILGAISGRSRIRATDVVAVVLAIGGAVLVIPDFRAGGGALGGMLLALASAFFYATLPILHHRVAHIPTSLRSLGQFGFALLLFLMFLPKSNWDLSGRDWAALWFLGIGATLIAHTLWVRFTTEVPPAVASIIYYGNVPFAVALGVILIGEPLTWRTAVGGLLIIGGGVAGLVPQMLQRRRNAALAPEM